MIRGRPSVENLSADEIYSNFVDSEKKYGYLNSYNEKLNLKWQHFRVSTSTPAFWKYYKCPPPPGSSSLVRTFCPDATETLLMLCNCKNLKSYQVGDLLKLRADPNCQSSENAETPLHRLIRLCKVKAVKLIVNWGADVQCKNIRGKTPLMTACDCKENQKQLQIIRFLLENKSIDVNAWDDEGNSAATLAVRNSNIWTIRELLMSGLSVTSIGRRGRYFSIDDVIASNNASVFDFTKNLREHTSGTEMKAGARASDLAEGIRWEDKSRLGFECVWRTKEEICFLMIQSKARNETIEGAKGTTVTPTVHSEEPVYIPGSILKGRKKLILKKIADTADENESEDGKEADITVVTYNKERDDSYLEKRKKEMRLIKSQKKKKGNAVDSENTVKSPGSPSKEDKEVQDTVLLLNSGTSNWPLKPRKGKKEKRHKSRSGLSRGGDSVTPTPSSHAEWLSIAPIRTVKTVTFKDE